MDPLSQSGRWWRRLPVVAAIAGLAVGLAAPAGSALFINSSTASATLAGPDAEGTDVCSALPVQLLAAVPSDVDVPTTDPAGYVDLLSDVAEYWLDVTDGALRIEQFGPTPQWLTLPESRAFYAEEGARRFIEDALAEAQIARHNGRAEVYVVFTGDGVRQFAAKDAPDRDQLLWVSSSPFTTDLPEVDEDSWVLLAGGDDPSSTSRLGDAAHELGHVAGLCFRNAFGGFNLPHPGDYDTPGYFGILGQGSWNDDRRTPPRPSSMTYAFTEVKPTLSVDAPSEVRLSVLPRADEVVRHDVDEDAVHSYFIELRTNDPTVDRWDAAIPHDEFGLVETPIPAWGVPIYYFDRTECAAQDRDRSSCWNREDEDKVGERLDVLTWRNRGHSHTVDPFTKRQFHLQGLFDRDAGEVTVAIDRWDDVLGVDLLGIAFRRPSSVWPFFFGGVSPPAPGPVPDIDLHAISADGRHEGIDYVTGEWDDGISGADPESVVSRDRPLGREWILVREPGARFLLSSVDTAMARAARGLDPDELGPDTAELVGITAGPGRYEQTTPLEVEIPAGAIVEIAVSVQQRPGGGFTLEVGHAQVSPSSLLVALAQYDAIGAFKDPDAYPGLRDKAEEFAAAVDAGRMRPAARILDAFERQVDADSLALDWVRDRLFEDITQLREVFELT